MTKAGASVTGWRNAELESIFGGPLDEQGITETSIAQLVALSVSESEVLDFKNGIGPWQTHPGQDPGTGEREFSKDVAALANLRGGLLLAGMDEKKGVAASPSRIPASVNTEAEEQRLRTALHNYQAPLAECRFVWVPAKPDGYYLAVVIPPSRRMPHAVITPGDSQHSLRFPVRHGRDTIWLTESEVAERYRRRLDAQQDERARMEQVVADGRTALEAADGVWLYVAAVPELRAVGRLDRQTAQRVEDWYQQARMYAPLGSQLMANDRGIAAPERMTFTGYNRSDPRSDELAISGGYVELYVDGSAFAAAPIGLNTDADGAGREVGEFTVVDDCVLLVDLAMQWCAHESGAWGTAAITAGFVDTDVAGGAIERPVVLVNSDTGATTRRVHRTRALQGHPRTTTVADLAAVDTLQRRLAVAYQVLSRLMQQFGLPDLSQIRPNGAVVPSDYGRHRSQVAEWAQLHGVETAPWSAT
jgi:hypothetical protein